MLRARAPSGPGKLPGLPKAAAGGDVTQSPKESARAQRQHGRSCLQLRGKRCRHPHGLRPPHTSLLTRPPQLSPAGPVAASLSAAGPEGQRRGRPGVTLPVSVSASPDVPIKRTKAPCGGPQQPLCGQLLSGPAPV